MAERVDCLQPCREYSHLPRSNPLGFPLPWYHLDVYHGSVLRHQPVSVVVAAAVVAVGAGTAAAEVPIQVAEQHGYAEEVG